MEELLQKIKSEKEKFLLMTIDSFESAIIFLKWSREYGHDFGWSIQYKGFGEHFTFMPGDATFTDFGIDAGTPITLKKMELILIESAKDLQELMQKLHRGEEV